MDGELNQVKEEKQEIWNVPRVQVGEAEEQQGELLSPWGQVGDLCGTETFQEPHSGPCKHHVSFQVSQKSREVHKLEQQLTEQEHKLEEKYEVFTSSSLL